MSTRTDGYCRQVIDVALTLGLSDADAKHAAMICWTAVGGETTWAMYANDGTSTLVCLTYDRQLNDAERAVARESLNYPHDAVGRNLDSMGLLQQRPMMEWGTPAELMDPPTSVGKFFHGVAGNEGLLDLDGWRTDEVWHAAWSVQKCGEADVHVYQNAAATAEADIDRLWPVTDWLDSSTYDDFVAATREGAGLQMVTREEYVAGLHEVFDPIRDMVAKHHPKAVHWGDGAHHYYSFGDGTYVQVPDPMGDGGVHENFRGNLLQAGTEIVEWSGPGQPLADPYMFGHRIPWSDRP